MVGWISFIWYRISAYSVYRTLNFYVSAFRLKPSEFGFQGTCTHVLRNSFNGSGNPCAQSIAVGRLYHINLVLLHTPKPKIARGKIRWTWWPLKSSAVDLATSEMCVHVVTHDAWRWAVLLKESVTFGAVRQVYSRSIEVIFVISSWFVQDVKKPVTFWWLHRTFTFDESLSCRRI